MKKSLKEIFKISNRYIVLATPLILFSLFSSIYLAFSVGQKPLSLLFSIVIFILMTSAFIAGWFNMVKIAILNPEKKDVNSLIKEFPAGVGEYFIQSIGILCMVILFVLLMIISSYFVGIHWIGNPHIAPDAFAKAMESTVTLKAFLTSLTSEQLKILNLWNVFALGVMSFIYFILMLYLPAFFFKKKNFIIAFWLGLKDLFGHKVLYNIAIYILLFAVYFTISIISAIFAGNVVFHFLITLLNFYYVIVASVGIFYYYYHNFVETQLGQNIDTRI